MEVKGRDWDESPAELFVQRGDMLLNANRYQEARVEYLNAIGSDPEHAWAYCRLGVCFAKLRMVEEAIEHGIKGVSLMPDLAGTHYQLAWIFNHVGERQEAERSARAALARDPQFVQALVLLAVTFLDRKRSEEALIAIEQAIALDPHNEDAFNIYGAASLEMGRLDDAQNALVHALSIQPENPAAHANLGYVFLHRGEWKRAEGHFRSALRLEPHYEYARLGYNKILQGKHPVIRFLIEQRLWLDRQPKGFGLFVLGILLVIMYGIAYVLHAFTAVGI